MSDKEITLDSWEPDSIPLSITQDSISKIYHVRPQEGANCRVVLESKGSPQIQYTLGEEFGLRIGDSDSAVGDAIEQELEKMKSGETCSFVVSIDNDMQDDSSAEGQEGEIVSRLADCEASTNSISLSLTLQF